MAMVSLVIGRIKPRPFENDGHRRKDTLRILSTTRAADGSIVIETSLQLKLSRATRTFIFVNGQIFHLLGYAMPLGIVSINYEFTSLTFR